MKARLKFRFTVLRFRLMGIWIRISRYKLLKFDLDDGDDWEEYLRCVKATEMCMVLWDLDQWLREQYKYHEKEYCYEIREQLSEIIISKFR